uniref:AAA+ ATPase domain-containing protein n=1 Tax=Globodera rostochiensis TaxID=31243 RepID=A0A914HAH8_GLORO
MDYPRINERELKFPIPSGIIVSGPSSSGKTQLVLRLLSCADEMFEPPPKAIVWAYGEYSAQIPELERQGIIVHAGPPADEMLNKLPKPFLIVYDDLMGEIDAKKLADLYTKKSHHNNFAVMFLTQNLFDKAMRVPRSNAQYIFLMRAPNDMLSIRNLATQIFPREQGFLIDAYKQACAEPYGYLLKQLIGQRVLENYEYLKTLGKTSSQKKIRHLLSSAGCEELLTLVEICLNILNGSFCLTNKQKQKIAPFANFIRKLARARSEKSARKLVLQSGGSLFAPLLAPILIEAARYLLSAQEDGQQTNSAAN